jgi:Predicted GTPase
LSFSASLYVYNKVDSIGLEFLDALAREPYTAVMSCELDLGVQDVVERIWKELRLMRLYTKRYDISMTFSFIDVSDEYHVYRKGEDPKFDEALIVRKDSTIEDVCDQIHRTIKDTFKYAMVWGASARHVPQRVGLAHLVADEDVVSIVAK